MPGKVCIPIGLNFIGGGLVFMFLYLLIQGKDFTVAVDAADMEARKECRVIFSSCTELRTINMEHEGCRLHFTKLTILDCSSYEPHLMQCSVNSTGTICRLTLFVSETSPAVSKGRYLRGRKMAAVVGRTASTIMPSPDTDLSKQQEASSPNYSHIKDHFIEILGGFSLLACAFICPCWQPKQKRAPKEIEKENELAFVSTSLERSSLSEASPETISKSSSSILPKSVETRTFTLADIAAMTQNFSASNIIGHGGFGVVYKGKLKDGTLVAIKRGRMGALQPRSSKEFQNEVETLSSINHLNLVKLIGCVEDDRELILVVEYLSNGNLREHLDGKRGRILDLATRLEIAIDVAHALTYLHQYADQPIIHRDVKSSNVLLTERFKAKVADFGFSKIGPTDAGKTYISTQVKGTAGYLDPEYYQTLQLTPKSDVYSFGVLLVELSSGRRPLERTRSSNELVTIRWAADKFVEGKAAEILDPKLEPTPAAALVIEPLIELALNCLAPTRRDRPTMQEVTTTLWEIRKGILRFSSQSS